MQAYSLDLRERVVADREAGLSTAEVARKYRPPYESSSLLPAGTPQSRR